MELLYTTHHSLANLHVLPTVFTWIVLLGAVYGAIRLVVDVARWILKEIRAPAVEEDTHHHALQG